MDEKIDRWRDVLVVVVLMRVTSVLACRMVLPRFCSGEFSSLYVP